VTADENEREALLVAAREAALCAYAPYSRFRVGAAVLIATSDGQRMVTGANVENASYGLTLCAERAALAATCALAQRTPAMAAPTIMRIALACIDAPAEAPVSARMPCGACRQWIAELAPDAIISVDGLTEDFTLTDLLPNPFELSERKTPDAPSR
jgi:cytidine deaminase